MVHRLLVRVRVVGATLPVLVVVLVLAVDTPGPSVLISYADLGFPLRAPRRGGATRMGSWAASVDRWGF